MKRIYVQEKWCLGCHLCEYHCDFANSGSDYMAKALMNKKINPRIHVEEGDGVFFAVSCRHCLEPHCVKSCITGALSKQDGVITVDRDRCVNCHTCVVSCPYGAIAPSDDGVMQKCELCLKNAIGEPSCVLHCPNRAIIYEDLGEEI
jgi:carbon-monoxide dehydrogenase iron sulfur subunit